MATFHDEAASTAEEPDVLLIGYLEDDIMWVTLEAGAATPRAAEAALNDDATGPRWRAVRRTWVRHNGDGDYVVCGPSDPGARPAWEMNRVPECFERQGGHGRRRGWRRG
ncbi:MAG: hypothetical protein ACR2NV_08010 [Thermoleophilaceae bacterium]